MRTIPVTRLPIEPLRPLIGDRRFTDLAEALAGAAAALDGRPVWNVNSTAAGGGVAEMLPRVLGYLAGAGLEAHWLVTAAGDDFFAITKRLHHVLHGMPGDGGPLGPAERAVYEDVLAANAHDLVRLAGPGDIVVLHDPQVLGLARPLRHAGAWVIWRSHIGADVVNEHTDRGWAFLRPYLGDVDVYAFSRRAYAPSWLDGPIAVTPPTIDPLSRKNQPLDRATVTSVLQATGIAGPAPAAEPVDILRSGPAPDLDAPLVVQVSRWDPLKDPAGLLDTFRHVRNPDCHLILAGPEASTVADDPEASDVLAGCAAARERLPASLRRRTHLVSLPMADLEANATMVNALQRHAAVVVQKSLAEGFGLTVTEAMWKGRPVVASAVGGIRDQIVDGRHGLLLENPADPVAAGAAVDRLLREPARAATLGRAASERARQLFLDDRQLRDWAGLCAGVAGRASDAERLMRRTA